MPITLKRYYGKGHLHFVTFSCYERRALLQAEDSREIVVHELGKIRDEMQFLLAGYVVMPEHVHLLIGEPLQGTPSNALQKLKLRTSLKLRKSATNSFAEFEQLPRAFWQTRFYDANIYSTEKKEEKLEYMHANPVSRGLVNHPRDWPWSSWSFYQGGSNYLLRMDFQE